MKRRIRDELERRRVQKEAARQAPADKPPKVEQIVLDQGLMLQAQLVAQRTGSPVANVVNFALQELFARSVKTSEYLRIGVCLTTPEGPPPEEKKPEDGESHEAFRARLQALAKGDAEKPERPHGVSRT